jgi:hypothetical protein
MHSTMVVELIRVDAVWAPRAALVDTPGGETVFVVEGTRARAVQPEIGRRTPQLVEVLGGLEPGDTVVMQGQHVLSDGDLVRVSSS